MTEFSGPPATKKMYALSAIIEERTAKGHGTGHGWGFQHPTSCVGY
jgi:hypothetical protein